MLTLRLPRLILGSLLLALSAPTPAQAGDGDFDKFCRTWMKKLEARETFNLKQAPIESRRGEFVLEYTGYSRKPSSCNANRSRNTLIGTLVYEEIRYQKTGAKRASVAKSDPVALSRAPVTEIFSHDGKEWLY